MGAAPAFVNASTPQTNAAQNLAVNMPASIVVGNLLVVVLRHSATSGVVTHAAGAFTAATGLNSSNASSVWFRRADGTEAASYTFTAAVANTLTDGVCFQISGAIEAGQPFHIVSTGLSGASVQSVTLSVTSTINNCLLVYTDAKNAQSRTLSTGPTGMTNNSGATNTMHLFTQVLTPAGASGNKDAVFTSSSAHYNTLLAITPRSEGQFSGTYDFAGTGWTGQAPPVPPNEGQFSGGYDFSGSFTGSAPTPPPGTGNRWTPGGRDRFTARRTPKNRRRSH